VIETPVPEGRPVAALLERLTAAVPSIYISSKTIISVVRTAIALLAVTGVTKFYFHWHGIRTATVGFTLLLLILLFAIWWGVLEAVSAAILGAFLFDYYFQPPLYHIEIDDPQGWLSTATLLCTAITLGYRSAKLKRQTIEAQQRREQLVSANLELEKRQKQIEKEKELSDSLLLSVFPAEVAEELRMQGKIAPRYLEDVTVLFTDFEGFSVSAETLSAEELVHEINDYFTEFDQITTRYGLEKLKTIGDSYMCISGFPVRRPSHAVDAVLAGFEMLTAVNNRNRPERNVRWNVRIGINTGPVIAGVVGIQKFAFDIWGETVNLASRMESSGEPNRINISESTYSRIKDFFECEYRGKITSKDGKDIDMYFANRLLPALQLRPIDGSSSGFGRRYRAYFQTDPPPFVKQTASDAGSVTSLEGEATA
jgi:class 3 adenylate cyclase